jgi:hypothetical protein
MSAERNARAKERLSENRGGAEAAPETPALQKGSLEKLRPRRRRLTKRV